ncbi:MAG TPA: hypothetical protein VFJ76_07710 [Solirubrobacterales bacterium]|nr:hypothetical protein [Solirubrobacterales bacterium]
MPEAPAEQEQPTTEPEAPETDQPEGEEESFTDSYNPNDVPEEARPQLEAAYKQLQSAYTQKTQGLAEERREAEQARAVVDALQNPNPQIRAATLARLGIDERTALEMFGYQPPEEGDDDFDDLAEVRDPRVDKLLQEREAEQASAQLEDDFAGAVEGIEKAEKRELSAKEHNTLWRIVQGDLAAHGTANVEQIWAEVKDQYSEREKALLDPKRTTPRPPGNGSSASRTVDLSKETSEERKERMADAVAAAQASQG